jgi:hypothetical protein
MVRIAGLPAPVDLDDPIYPGSNFTWREATKDGTRLPVKTNFNAIILSAAQITANIIKLARELDKLRAEFGNRPITVTSWYRPPGINEAVGGSTGSFHKTGLGADIQVWGVNPRTVQARLKTRWPGGLGLNSQYTHVDLRHLLGYASANWNYGGA